MSEEYAVILVPSTSYAIQIERLLQGAGMECKMIPVPRHLSSDCGVCVRIRREQGEEIMGRIRQAGIDSEGLHNI